MHLDTLMRPRTWDQIGHRGAVKPTNIILLNEQINKTAPNDILLFPWIRASLNPLQRSFFLQRWPLMQRPKTRQCAESARSWSTQSWMECLYHSFPSGLRIYPLHLRGGKTVRAGDNGGLQGNCFPHTTGQGHKWIPRDSDRMWRPTQAQANTGVGK